MSALESVPSGTGRRTGPRPGGLPLSAGHEQVEQGRASPLQLHYAELAWPAAGQPRDGRQPDRQHADAHRPGREAALDTNHYETAIKVSDAEYATLRMTPAPISW